MDRPRAMLHVLSASPVHSLINFTVVLYALVYAPLMYYTFVLDSKQLRMEKHARQVAEASSAYGAAM